MKKPVIISIIAILLVAIVAAVVFAVSSGNQSTATPDSAPTTAQTTAPTEKATTAPTTAETEAPTTAPQQTQTTSEEIDTNENSDDELVLPDVTGMWKHESNEGCSIKVENQRGNTLDLIIESRNSTYTKIATSKVTVTLNTYKEEGHPEVFGAAHFGYYDSFGSGGEGSIVISENKIDLIIDKEFDPVAAWNITGATGSYYHAN